MQKKKKNPKQVWSFSSEETLKAKYIIYINNLKKARYVTYFPPQNQVISYWNEILLKKKSHMKGTVGG